MSNKHLATLSFDVPARQRESQIEHQIAGAAGISGTVATHKELRSVLGSRHSGSRPAWPLFLSLAPASYWSHIPGMKC